MTLTLYIDADACPVREECYKVARRHEVPVIVVSNSFLRVPREPLITFIAVSDGFDTADDYIAERANARSVVVTSDILLAERCLKQDAAVLAPNGKAFTKDSIGGAIATRAIMADLRAGADMPNMGGPPPFTHKDRSKFLESLHVTLEKLKRQNS
ncbi:YaiI/YqxD family protein [Hellea balneolensis]|uniref:YaiI/YqxD family protein n=1 Tax=Hellea balneolensis TaxID=287478 RepID=UPI0004156F21|nr:YaiI/YqxD family protein [Hellea balneolensis]